MVPTLTHMASQVGFIHGDVEADLKADETCRPG